MSSHIVVLNNKEKIYIINHPVTTSVFLADFSIFFGQYHNVILLIAGDFNIHVDVPRNSDNVCLKELLESMGLQQHVNEPTRETGHSLDLIITRQCDSLFSNIPVTDCLFSDHSFFDLLSNPGQTTATEERNLFQED